MTYRESQGLEIIDWKARLAMLTTISNEELLMWSSEATKWISNPVGNQHILVHRQRKDTSQGHIKGQPVSYFLVELSTRFFYAINRRDSQTASKILAEIDELCLVFVEANKDD